MSELEDKIKRVIIESLELEDLTPNDIDSSEPLFGEGLGLDSIDALELGLAIKKSFSVNLEDDNEDAKKHFYSVKTLANFIENN